MKKIFAAALAVGLMIPAMTMAAPKAVNSSKLMNDYSRYAVVYTSDEERIYVDTETLERDPVNAGELPIIRGTLYAEIYNPKNVEFKPDGKSPLAKCESFMNTTCPVCGGKAQRDPDTLDTFVCSSWYYLRYPDNKNANAPFDPEIINKMLPVDKYVGPPLGS